MTVYLDVVPDTSYWTGEYNNDFNNDSNWTLGSPGYCTYAVITNLEGKYYPIIYDSATVDVIYFEPGGAVLGLEKLIYNRAYVDATFEVDQWYTITAPLKEMYSGDYYYMGRPMTYMRLFDAFNPDDNGTGEKAVGTWTNPFATLTTPLEPGVGYAFLVDSMYYNWPDVPYHSGDAYTVHFPREDEEGNLISDYYLISGLTGKIYYQYTQSVTRDTTYAYRFAMEDENNVLQDVNVPIEPGLNLVGNPMMSHLDFTKLYASNSSVISNKVKFWNGTTFTTYMVGDDIAADMDLDHTIIPPMQSFFVEGITSGSMLIDLDEHFVADTLTELRRAKARQNPLMHIEANMGDFRSSTAVSMTPKQIMPMMMQMPLNCLQNMMRWLMFIPWPTLILLTLISSQGCRI